MEPEPEHGPRRAPSSTSRAVLAVLLILAGLVALGNGVASANGRATLVSSQDAGPYRVDISLLPGQAVVGRTHISVLLRSLATGEILTSAKVDVSAAGPEGSANLEPLAALNEFAPSFFETDLAFDLPGQWEVLVAVSSELGEATVLLPLEVREGGGGINLILIVAVAVAGLAVVGFFIRGRCGYKPTSRKRR